MREDWGQLEESIERMLVEWSDGLDVQPAPAAVTRVQASVRHALNEEWLAGQLDSPPSEEALETVRSAVRQELLHANGGRVVPKRRRWIGVVAGLTAAAAVVAAAVLLHQRMGGATRPSDNSRPSGIVQNTPFPARGLRRESGTETAVDLFVTASERVWAAHPLTAELRSDMDALEESLSGADNRPNTVEEMIEDIGQELDDLLSEPVWQQQTSGWTVPSKGAIG